MAKLRIATPPRVAHAKPPGPKVKELPKNTNKLFPCVSIMLLAEGEGGFSQMITFDHKGHQKRQYGT